MQSSLKSNIATNISGQLWSILAQILFVPFYIKFLGIEAYGLIGFYLMLQSILRILDLGMTPTMTRELARYSSLSKDPEELRDFLRTMESAYWFMGLIISLLMIFSSSFIAHDWIGIAGMSRDSIQATIILMAVAAFFQWPLGLYQGAFMGVERQVSFNVIKVVMSTLNGTGAVLVLWLISPSIQAFFQWQIVTGGLYVLLLASFLWRGLPKAKRPPRFQAFHIRRVLSFALGMSGLAITGIVLTQADKLILSRMLSLEHYGYYMLAATVAGGLNLFILALFNAFFPRFSALSVLESEEYLRRLYHRAAQATTILVIPISAALALYSFEILELWTQNSVAAQNSSSILVFLVCGTAVNGMMHVPYALQLSHGWTSLGLRINVALILLMVPLILILTPLYGAVGAASVWLIVNVMYFLVGTPLTHRRVLKGETQAWYLRDIGMIAVPAVALSVAVRLITGQPSGWLATATTVTLTYLLTASTAVVSSPEIRVLTINTVSRILKRNRS